MVVRAAVLHSISRRSRAPWNGAVKLAEADGNRTRLTEMLGHYGFEDRARHQTRNASGAHPRRSA